MKRDFIKYFTALLLFGCNGIVASSISLHSYLIVFLRTMLGSMLLGTLFFLSGHKLSVKKHPHDLLYITISGMAMGTSWLFLFEAYGQIGVSVSSLLYYCGPILVMALSPLLFHEKLTISKLVGFAAVLCGVFLINGKAAEGLNIWGIVCGATSAVFYAIMVVANKKTKNITGLENSCIQLFVSFLTVAIFVGCKTGLDFKVTPGDWIWIVALGFINTGIGCYLYFSSIGNLRVQTVALCGYLEPASAVLFSVLFLHEAISFWQFIGAAFIIGGAVFGEMHGRKQ